MRGILRYAHYRWFQNSSSTLYFNFRRRLRNALCKDVSGGCSHHTNQARIYLKSDTSLLEDYTSILHSFI